MIFARHFLESVRKRSVTNVMKQSGGEDDDTLFITAAFGTNPDDALEKLSSNLHDAD